MCTTILVSLEVAEFVKMLLFNYCPSWMDFVATQSPKYPLYLSDDLFDFAFSLVWHCIAAGMQVQRSLCRPNYSYFSTWINSQSQVFLIALSGNLYGFMQPMSPGFYRKTLDQCRKNMLVLSLCTKMLMPAQRWRKSWKRDLFNYCSSLTDFVATWRNCLPPKETE